MFHCINRLCKENERSRCLKQYICKFMYFSGMTRQMNFRFMGGGEAIFREILQMTFWRGGSRIFSNH